ncbi:hypothetical protein TU82_17375 [Pseudomonas orientalis]|nr:hypothetical protein TU82_17375 [Pseudomonas orientalis]
MACMGWGSCFCVVQTKLPTHAGFFNNSNFLIFRKKNRGSLRVRPLFFWRSTKRGLTPVFPRPSWVIVPRKDAALLRDSPLEPLAPSFQERLNDNALMVFLLN